MPQLAFALRLYAALRCVIGGHRGGGGVCAGGAAFLQEIQTVHVLPHKGVEILGDDEHGDLGRIIRGLAILHLMVQNGCLLIIFIFKNDGLLIRICVVSRVIGQTESSLTIFWVCDDVCRLCNNISKTILLRALKDLANYGWKGP
jgi:hypothetical protein